MKAVSASVFQTGDLAGRFCGLPKQFVTFTKEFWGSGGCKQLTCNPTAVIEVHSRSWGVCGCAFAGLLKMYKAYNEKTPIRIFSCESDDVPELLEFTGRACSFFQVWKNNQDQGFCEGPNLPVLTRLVSECMPTPDEYNSTGQMADSEDEAGAAPTETAKPGKGGRRGSISGGLGRRRSVVKG